MSRATMQATVIVRDVKEKSIAFWRGGTRVSINPMTGCASCREIWTWIPLCHVERPEPAAAGQPERVIVDEWAARRAGLHLPVE